MDSIHINTGITGFHLISSVTSLTEQSIEGSAFFTDSPAFVAMESLAQLGALHVRKLLDFSKHAFLLKVETCSLPDIEQLTGVLEVSGVLVARSQSSFSYDLAGQANGKEIISGRFVFSVKDYDESFRGEILEKRYREVLACLKSGSKIA